MERKTQVTVATMLQRELRDLVAELSAIRRELEALRLTVAELVL